MKNHLESRRQRLIRKLARIDRHIAWTQNSMARIDSRIAVLEQAKRKAA
jgi:hypothetical protein